MTEKPIFGIFNDRNYEKQLGHDRLLTDTYVDHHVTPHTLTSLIIPAKKKKSHFFQIPSLPLQNILYMDIKVQLFHVNTYIIHIWNIPASIRQNQQLKWNIPSLTEGRTHHVMFTSKGHVRAHAYGKCMCMMGSYVSD